MGHSEWSKTSANAYCMSACYVSMSCVQERGVIMLAHLMAMM